MKKKAFPKIGRIVYGGKLYDSVEQAAAKTGKSISQVQYAVYRKYKRAVSKG